MAIKVTILSDFEPEDLDAVQNPEFVEAVLESVMSGARSEWVRFAEVRLKSTRRDYVEGIQPVELGPGYAAIELLGDLPNMVENGADPYDLHQTLLGPSVPVVPRGGGRGKHVNKDGKFYRSIPFRHQTPGTAGQGGGAVMGAAYASHRTLGREAFEHDHIWAMVTGNRIARKARALRPTTQAGPGHPTQWGGRLPAGLAPKLRSHHSTDIFAGMVKVQKTYPGGRQNTYMTFRTISDSVPDKWQHPGIEAAHLADEVQRYVERIAGDAFLVAADRLLS